MKAFIAINGKVLGYIILIAAFFGLISHLQSSHDILNPTTCWKDWAIVGPAYLGWFILNILAKKFEIELLEAEYAKKIDAENEKKGSYHLAMEDLFLNDTNVPEKQKEAYRLVANVNMQIQILNNYWEDVNYDRPTLTTENDPVLTNEKY